MAKTPTYHSWAMMKQRCYNENSTVSDRYAGRGIKVCARWLDSFAAFFEDMGERPAGTSLDRIDNDGDYSPENCRWATPKQQSNNTRKTLRITIGDETLLARDVADTKGISYDKLYGRLNGCGWRMEEALEIEPHFDPRAVAFNGEARTKAQWAKHLGISRQAMDQRIRVAGWDIEKALTTPRTA